MRYYKIIYSVGTSAQKLSTNQLLAARRMRHKGSTAARYDMNSVGRMARFRALSRTPLRCCAFPSLDSLGRPSPISPSEPAAPRSAGASLRTAVGSGDPSPAGAIVSSVLDQTPAGLDQSLLQARQRPRVDPLRQHQPAPQVPEVIGQDAQLQSDLVRSESVTRHPSGSSAARSCA